ncbi:hypothetical protein BBU64B_F0010 (plasmid) [Borreliella burgdorferi 64b]|nr:hypothetical protein BBU64B_F0010 [Borreliella burgdorferi 64b]
MFIYKFFKILKNSFIEILNIVIFELCLVNIFLIKKIF